MSNPSYFSTRLPAGLHELAGMWFLALLILFSSGCASHLQSRAVARADSPLPRQVELAQTPFHAQTKHHCGPAALAMLLNAQDIDVEPDQLANLTYLPGRAGSLGMELLATPRSFGLLGYRVEPQLEALLAEVAGGHPVLVLQNLGLNWLPQWHYAVLIGYDLDRGRAILRSGITERLDMPLDTFERTWLRGERWAMLTLAPGDTPARPQQTAYLKGALGLEQVGQHQAAARAYERVTQLWPQDVNGWMALGNNRYATGDARAAEAAFRRALEVNSHFAPAANNLAQLLLERGKLGEAERWVQQALAASDAHAAIYQSTLDEIQRRKAGVNADTGAANPL